MHRSQQRINQIGLKTALSLMGCQEIEGDKAPSLSLSYKTDIDRILTSDIPCLEPADESCESHSSVVTVDSSPPNCKAEVETEVIY